MVIALVGAIFSYVFIQTGVLAIGSKVLTRSDGFNEYVNQGATELVSALEKDVNNIGEILKWNLEYPELQVSLYRADELYYTSPDFQTSDYGLEDIYIFEITTAYGIEEVHISPCYTQKFILQMRIMSLTASGILFIFFTLFMCHYKFKYLLLISETLKMMEVGNLKKRIVVQGEDELAQVAMNINALADRIEEDIEAEKQLRAQNMQMVSSLSHDIRTPLTAVISYLDFLYRKMYVSQEQMDEYIQIASQKALQIKGVTDTLFAYTGDNKQDFSKKDQVFKVDILVNQIFLEMDDWLESAGFQFVYKNNISHKYEISIDIMLLRRILDNLCSNIEKYGDCNSPVHAVVKVEEGKLVFNLLNKKREDQRKCVESHGIGLKNCRSIIEGYGGNLEVKVDKTFFEVIIELYLQNSLELPIKNLQK